jgi:hypothetical protein
MHLHSTQLPLPLETEEWRPVVRYEGWYEVSSLGRVRRIAGGKGTRGKAYVLKPWRLHGYPVVRLYDSESRPNNCFVHLLVARAFCETAPNWTEVNHKDGRHDNNAASNLEWVTHSANMSHALKLGLIRLPDNRGQRSARSLLTEAAVHQIRALHNIKSRQQLAEQFGVTMGCIDKVIYRRTWRHL